MTGDDSLIIQRITGVVLVLAFVPLTLGIFLFMNRGGIQGGEPRSTALFALERGSLIAAVVLTALGLTLFEKIFTVSGAAAFARLGAVTYLIGAVLLVAAEAMALPRGEYSYPLIVVYIVLALLGQAAVGLALIQSGFIADWIGWVTLVWNLAFLIVLPLATPKDMYYPFIHHLMPLLIGISLLMRK